jgi:Fe2+ or Zn2+ uptake regulation protein
MEGDKWRYKGVTQESHKDVEVPIMVKLDKLDQRILSIIQKAPTKGWKVRQIHPILIDAGFHINYGQVTRRLDILCTLTLIEKRKVSGKVFKYYLPKNGAKRTD